MDGTNVKIIQKSIFVCTTDTVETRKVMQSLLFGLSVSIRTLGGKNVLRTDVWPVQIIKQEIKLLQTL
jgi:hypothetical protein